MRRRSFLRVGLFVGSSAMFVGGGCGGDEGHATPPEFLTPVQKDGTCPVSLEACKALDVELLALLPTDEERRLEPELGRCGCVDLSVLPGAEESLPVDGVCPHACSIDGATLWGVCPFKMDETMGSCTCRCLTFPLDSRRCMSGSVSTVCDVLRVSAHKASQ